MTIDPQTITEIVAIDGPAGAGKSSAARQAAAALNYAFLDTGAMYRAATWNALERNVDMNDRAALESATRAMDLDLRETNGKQLVLVDGKDVTSEIRTPHVTNNIFKLDQAPGVRAHLVQLQRQFGARQPTVAEGRDIGTVVFPSARCKIYMIADLAERARRRHLELASQGRDVPLESLQREIAERDRKDQTRAASPLRQADDAHVLDTTALTQEQVVEAIVKLARSTA
jgi:CMP/dCMP kinase